MKKEQKKFIKGFTLLELLVVIAIIGVLASVILASLNSARSKGEDAAIKSNIKTIGTQSAIYYDANSEFYSSANVFPSSSTTTCNAANTFLTDPVIARAVSAIIAVRPTGSRICVLTTVTGGSSLVNAWALVFPLAQNANTYWCIDSSGTSREKNASGTAYNGTTTGTAAALSNNSDTTCN
ncbi:MAG: type II secretion system protein [Candidatus Pacebacteria bacterium]|nr:type II secretion system protein [Candidatus Paceibacterota bacterium]